MAEKEMQKVLSQADMMNLLDSLYSMQIAKPNGPFCGAERPQCGASGQPFPT